MPQPPIAFFDPAKTFDENVAEAPWLEEVTYQPPTGAPQYDLLGHKVHLPFGIASSAVVASSAQVKAAFDRGFDVITFKTQRSVPFPCNPFPNVVPTTADGPLTLAEMKAGLTMAEEWNDDLSQCSMINSFGNPCNGPDYWLPEVKQAAAAAHPGQLLIVSTSGTIQDGFSEEDYFNDFAEVARLANKAAPTAIEVDISCANVASEAIVCYTPESVQEIVPRVKAAIGDTPLLIKLAYFAPELQPHLEEVIDIIAPHVSGISAINAISVPIRKADGSQALPGRLNAGFSGLAIKWAGLDMVKRLDAIRRAKGYSYEIFGIGGVMTPADFQEYRDAGAHCVQSVTAAMWNPNLAIEIKQSLAK